MKHATLFKKALSLLCAFALLFSLAACGEAPGGDVPASVPESTAEAGLPIAPGGKVQAADLLEDFTPQPVETKQADEAFAGALYRLGSLLLQKVREEKPGENLLVSPLSVLTALTMTANGAAGTTLEEMEKVLGGSLKLADLNAYQAGWYQSLAASEDLTLCFANAIWFKEEQDLIIKDSFLQKNVDHFTAAIRKAPFNEDTLREINQWTDTNTHHMIPKVLEELDPADVMVLLNALCFEAKWAEPFDENAIDKAAPFTAEGGTVRTVSQMRGTVRQYLADESCTGFCKDYKGGYSYVALLPAEGVSLEDFIASLSAEKLSKLLAGQENTAVSVGLPKYSYDFGIDLAQALMDLGMPTAFVGADFSGITDSCPLSIGRVIHKTHIDVDSEGTKAAAVTAVTMRKNAAPFYPDQKEVVLDRPFVYLILDQNGIPLFMGAVSDIAP